MVKSGLCQKHSMVLFCNCVKTMSCIFFPLGLASFLRYNVCQKIFIEARLKFCSVLEPECISCTSNTKDMQALYAILVVCQIFFIYLFFYCKKNYLLVSILVPSMSGQAMYVLQTNQIEATMSSKFNCRLQRYLFSLWMQVLYTCINKCCSQSHTVFTLKGSLESILRYSFEVVFSVKTKEIMDG